MRKNITKSNTSAARKRNTWLYSLFVYQIGISVLVFLFAGLFLTPIISTPILSFYSLEWWTNVFYFFINLYALLCLKVIWEWNKVGLYGLFAYYSLYLIIGFFIHNVTLYAFCLIGFVLLVFSTYTNWKKFV